MTAKERKKAEKKKRKEEEKRKKKEKSEGRPMVIEGPINVTHVSHIGWDGVNGFQVLILFGPHLL